MTDASTTIIEACGDPSLFARWFRQPETWRAWFVFLRALFGLGGLTPEDLTLFAQCTGREAPAAAGYREAWLICGRRAGKSITLAVIAVFLACFVDPKSGSWRPAGGGKSLIS